jgi:hypothetical protein
MVALESFFSFFSFYVVIQILRSNVNYDTLIGVSPQVISKRCLTSLFI